MQKPMNFKEWLATARELSPEDAEREFRAYIGEECEYVVAFDPGYMESHIGKYWAQIGRDEYVGDFDDVAAWVFINWAVPECFEFSRELAPEWLSIFCRVYVLPRKSAKELHADLLLVERPNSDTYNARNWLAWFCENMGDLA